MFRLAWGCQQLWKSEPGGDQSRRWELLIFSFTQVSSSFSWMSVQCTCWLLIVYFHCIGIQRLYIRLWWYGKIISLNPTTTGVEPSERSWRSKEHIFISMRTLIHRVFSRKSGYYTRLQKSGICIFILCALSATRNCVFSCQKKKKKIGMNGMIWWDTV